MLPFEGGGGGVKDAMMRVFEGLSVSTKEGGGRHTKAEEWTKG